MKEGDFMAQAIVYSTPTCPYCRYVKQFLDSKGVSYAEKDVASDRMAAAEMVRKSGQQGVPVTLIADEVIVGFDKDALNRAVLKIKAQGQAPVGFKLGVKVADAATVLAGQNQSGAVLGPIPAGSAAAQAGLKQGDIIVALGSHAVKNVDDLQKALAALANLPIAGMADMVGLTYLRDGQRLQARLKLTGK